MYLEKSLAMHWKLLKTVPVVCLNLNEIGYIRMLSILTRGLDPESSLNNLRFTFPKLSTPNCIDIEYVEYILYIEPIQCFTWGSLIHTCQRLPLKPPDNLVFLSLPVLLPILL